MEDESEIKAYKEESQATGDKVKDEAPKADEETTPKVELIKEIEMNGHAKK